MVQAFFFSIFLLLLFVLFCFLGFCFVLFFGGGSLNFWCRGWSGILFILFCMDEKFGLSPAPKWFSSSGLFHFSYGSGYHGTRDCPQATAVHLLPFSSSLCPRAAEATAADGCLLSVLLAERFYSGEGGGGGHSVHMSVLNTQFTIKFLDSC